MLIKNESMFDIIEALNSRIIKLESKSFMSCDCSGCEEVFPDLKSRIDELKNIVKFFEDGEEKMRSLKEKGYSIDVKVRMDGNNPIADYELIYFE